MVRFQTKDKYITIITGILDNTQLPSLMSDSGLTLGPNCRAV